MEFDGGETFEIWLPATVCHVSDTQIGVAFGGGKRLALARGRGLWRIARERKP